MLRVAHSISLNITKGNGKRSLKDQARLLNYSWFSIGVCC
ncbi:MAG: hypothetical protein ACK5T6_01595, partial [Pirellula sp.]